MHINATQGEGTKIHTLNCSAERIGLGPRLQCGRKYCADAQRGRSESKVCPRTFLPPLLTYTRTTCTCSHASAGPSCSCNAVAHVNAYCVSTVNADHISGGRPPKGDEQLAQLYGERERGGRRPSTTEPPATPPPPSPSMRNVPTASTEAGVLRHGERALSTEICAL